MNASGGPRVWQFLWWRRVLRELACFHRDPESAERKSGRLCGMTSLPGCCAEVGAAHSTRSTLTIAEDGNGVSSLRLYVHRTVRAAVHEA